jgi:hypothetical protein
LNLFPLSHSHNKLGDNLSPVFSTGEFQNLKFLRVLDLSHNGLLGIADTLIKGCESLKVSTQRSKFVQRLSSMINSIQYVKIDLERTSFDVIGSYLTPLHLPAQC